VESRQGRLWQQAKISKSRKNFSAGAKTQKLGVCPVLLSTRAQFLKKKKNPPKQHRNKKNKKIKKIMSESQTNQATSTPDEC